MAGLSEYLTDKGITTEKMPSWFTSAQEQLVSNVGQAATPALGQTTAQKAIDVFGAGSPFSSAQSTLESIGSGAVNPWVTTADATGKTTVAPNLNTPMGGLFGAQQQYLNQILPDIEAAETAKAIGSGGFGSRMNLSGVERVKGQAAADLFQKQMAAALQNQQLGVQAGTGLGNLGAQVAKGALDVGTFEQAYPYANLINAANIYGKLGPTVGKTTEVTKRLALPAQLGALSTIFGGSQQGLQGLYGNLSNFFNWAGGALGSGGGTLPGSIDISGTADAGYDPYADYGYTYEG